MEEIAEVYARALFEAAKDDDVLDRVHDELGEFADALDSDRTLPVFLFSPYFSSEEKKAGVRRIVSDADERLLNFLELLAERHRMPVLFRIRRIFDGDWAEENKLLPVTVTSATELDAGLVEEIGRRIQEQTGRRVDLSSNVDPDVLGGLMVDNAAHIGGFAGGYFAGRLLDPLKPERIDHLVIAALCLLASVGAIVPRIIAGIIAVIQAS